VLVLLHLLLWLLHEHAVRLLLLLRQEGRGRHHHASISGILLLLRHSPHLSPARQTTVVQQ
jgi:hypothetical protein